MNVEITYQGVPLDLYSDTDIKFTFQVNDIADVKTRQANYTNSFTIPKTPHNVQLLQGLGISSDTSNAPYRKPTCTVKIDGFSIIPNGWLNISETTPNEYRIHIYSGVIDFFKAIENKTLGGDLDLKEIDHEKNLASVRASIDNDNYKYLIADYNGKLYAGDETDHKKINIDYLIPSVKVSYLWKKIHQQFGFTYSGKIFNNPDFQNLMLTYPKGLNVTKAQVIKKEFQEQEHDVTYTETFTIDTDGKYKLELLMLCEVNARIFNEGYQLKAVLKRNSIEYRILVDVSKHYSNLNTAPGLDHIWVRVPVKGEFSGVNEDFAFQRGDIIEITAETNGQKIYITGYEYKLTFEKSIDISFASELKSFTVTDFIKEVINRFGLTMFVDGSTVKYLTLGERLNEAPKIDWSDKYIGRTSEKYIFSSYAQKNIFKYKYSISEAQYNDDAIYIDNANIPDAKAVFESKTYSPELGNNIFKIYDKEVEKKDGEIQMKYKPLSGRHFFVYPVKIDEAIELSSEAELGNTINLNYYYGATFRGNQWGIIISKYYPEFRQLISGSRMHEIELNLNEVDILTLELNRIYYFKQEAQYYLLNSISYDRNGTKGEFIRVNKSHKSGGTTPTPPPDQSKLVISFADGTTTPRKEYIMENYTIGFLTGNPKIESPSLLNEIIKVHILRDDYKKRVVFGWIYYFDGSDFVPADEPIQFNDDGSFDWYCRFDLLYPNKIKVQYTLDDGTKIFSNILECQLLYKLKGNQGGIPECQSLLMEYKCYFKLGYIDCSGKYKETIIDNRNNCDGRNKEVQIEMIGFLKHKHD